jgi:hypothetical protein
MALRLLLLVEVIAATFVVVLLLFTTVFEFCFFAAPVLEMTVFEMIVFDVTVLTTGFAMALTAGAESPAGGADGSAAALELATITSGDSTRRALKNRVFSGEGMGKPGGKFKRVKISSTNF